MWENLDSRFTKLPLADEEILNSCGNTGHFPAGEKKLNIQRSLKNKL